MKNISIMEIVNISEWNTKIEEAFNRAKVNIPSYQKDLDVIIDVLSKELNIRERIELEERKKFLSSLIDDLTNDVSLGFYMMEVEEFIEEFSKNFQTPVKISFMKKDRVDNTNVNDCIKLTQKFIDTVAKYNYILNLELPSVIPITQTTNIVCSCGNNKDFEIIDKRIYYCLKCGIQIKENIGTRSTFKDTERINVSSKFKYTRMVHFKNSIKQLQGKQKTRVPPECLKNVKKQLIMNGTSKNTNPQHIRTALHETGWSSQYENFVLIWSIITSNPCPDISHIEDDIISDFQLIEKTYNEICEKEDVSSGGDRTSFMSYQYVLYQLLRKHNFDCDINFFNMLKSDRINWLDLTLEKIYFELEWSGFKSLS